MVQGKVLNVALIGQGFMGRTHANAWGQVGRFFPTPRRPRLYLSAGEQRPDPRIFAEKWGFAKSTADWTDALADEQVDLVDIVTPNWLHAEMAQAAIAAGKHVACEKPISATLEQAAAMAKAAAKAKVKTFVWFNYRRVPAVALARQLVKAGRIGQIRHVRAAYLQDWAGEQAPMAWRFKKELAGSGAHGDLNAHIVDMTRFVTGQEITDICGAVAQTFIKRRKNVDGRGTSKVTVDDTVLFLAQFSGGAVASFEAARQATGNQNRNRFEINGTKGSLRFDFERMNELEFYDATADRAVQGWTNIMCTHGQDHPYVRNWWPDAHLIGYEHTFANQAYDIVNVLSGKAPLAPLADFNDAYQTQRVLEAALISARRRTWVKLSQVK